MSNKGGAVGFQLYTGIRAIARILSLSLSFFSSLKTHRIGVGLNKQGCKLFCTFIGERKAVALEGLSPQGGTSSTCKLFCISAYNPSPGRTNWNASVACLDGILSPLNKRGIRVAKSPPICLILSNL
jgi:hypothetical protein